MEPTMFYVGLYFLVSLLKLASSRIDSYNGWKNSPNVQYHIQTDEGEERFFKYQTKSGQYRKEKRLEDGTVVGTYGWVDPNGYLRLRDYIADNQGYRILKTKMIYVGGNSISGDSTSGNFHTKYSSLSGATFQLPFENQNHRFGGYFPPTPNAYVSPNGNTYLSPYFRQSYEGFTTTPASTARFVAIFNDPTPTPTTPYSSTPKPIAVKYVSSTLNPAVYSWTPSPIEHTTAHSFPAMGIASSTTPLPPLPAVSGKFAFFNRNNNFLKETEKNKLFFQYEDKNNDFYNNNNLVDYKNDFQEYDGIATVQNGFRYYLPRHYHEEESSLDGQERIGSFGYIDPFGIRRVIYYNTAPGRGFAHRKNNRYVGFKATPYDPRSNY